MVDDHTKQLLDVCRLLASQRDVGTLMTDVMNKCKEIVPADRCSLWVPVRKPGTLITMVGQGLNEALEISLKNPSLVGTCMNDQCEICVEDAYAPGMNFNRAVDKAVGYHTRSVLCIPIQSHPPEGVTQRLGVLQVINRKDAGGKRVHLRCERRYVRIGPFREPDLILLREVVGFLAGALERMGLLAENTELLRQSRQAVRSLCLVLARVIDLRDGTTGTHTWSVINIAIAIAKQLALTKELLRLIEMAAALHDLGKLKIPDGVLNFRGPLSLEAREEMERHPEYGRKLLEDLSWPPELVQAMDAGFNHHERPDGTGYPRRLSKDAIGLITRTISVADTFDALVADRPYRPAKDPRTALDICLSAVPHQLDELCVRALEAALEECDFDLERLRGSAKDIRDGLH